MLADAKSAKNTAKPSIFLHFLGSERVVAVGKFLVKLTSVHGIRENK